MLTYVSYIRRITSKINVFRYFCIFPLFTYYYKKNNFKLKSSRRTFALTIEELHLGNKLNGGSINNSKFEKIEYENKGRC